VLRFRAMPRARKPRAHDWVAAGPDDRRGPQGRPRSGPKGIAVRQLPRVTVRALGRTLALWEAICETQALPAHEAFANALKAYLGTLDADTAAQVERRSRAIRRERFGDAP
jgi:hypothetical protein